MEIDGASALGLNQPGLNVRTVYPVFSPDPFTKYELSFTPTSGGEAHDPVLVTGGTGTVDLVVGTYTVTATAYTGSGTFTATAEGSTTGVVVTNSVTTPVSITLGPKTGTANGTFKYDITVPAGVVNATLTLKKDGIDVGGSPITLTIGGQKSDTISLAPGYYTVQVVLSKGTKTAGLFEVIHIYSGLDSILPAKVYADSDFTEAAAVTDSVLTGFFTAPVTGTTAAVSFDASQYTGAIAWTPAIPGDGKFAGGAAYTAVITLTAKPGFTFTGVPANFFSYTGATSVSYTAGSSAVSIAFGATVIQQGSLTVNIGFNNGIITVSGGNGTNTIYRTGTPNSLTLDVTDFTNIGWYIDGNTTALSTAASLTLLAASYDPGSHIVSFTGKKGGIPYSKVVPFTVAMSRPADVSAGSLTGLGTTLANVSGKGDSVTDPIKLTLTTVTFTDLGTRLDNLFTALDAGGKYVDVDLSGISNNGGADTVLTGFNSAGGSGRNYLIGITLPDWLTEIGDSAFRNTGLVHIELPASLQIIEDSAFRGCAELLWVKWPASPANASLGHDANGAVFRDCTKLQKVQLPAGLTTIKNRVLQATDLQTLVLPATAAPTLGTNVFLNVTGGGYTVYVPGAKVLDYQGAANWSAISTNIVSDATLTDLPNDW
jgi:hypothetical protein